MRPSLVNLALVFILWLGLTGGCCSSSNLAQELNQEHRNAIRSALQAQGLTEPSSLEITGGFLVATYEMSSGAGAREFAERAVLTIREVMLPYHLVDAYRVTINGPSPGTGLIRRYGSARFTDRLEWEPGLR
jgi:hypothetical protein